MTQLCTIPGCRIRNRHLPGCEAEACGGCLPRTAHEGYTCETCEGRAVDQLALIAELAPDARAVAAGLVRRGAGGGASGKPGSRPPLNDTATDTLDAIQNALTTMAREIAETRGLQSDFAGSGGPGVTDPLGRVCSWLSGQMRWVRHALDDQGGAYAVGVFAEIADCARRVRGVVNGPGEQKYLGPCGAVVEVDGECDCACHLGIYHACDHPGGCGSTEGAHRATCTGDVYGWLGAAAGACKTCGTQVRQDERRAWLDGEVRSRAFTAKDIGDAYGVNVKTIRSWANRGQLKTWWRTEAGIVVPWSDYAGELDAERLHYVGDVLDLAAADAARRETERAKRARREAVAQATEMGA